MSTLRRPILVSMVAMSVLVALSGCVQPAAARGGLSPVGDDRLVFQFDNGSAEYVHVYLVGQRRQWILGRVEPGAIATLRVPRQALSEDGGFGRLAVIAGGRLTLQATRNPRARVSLGQPVRSLISQRWQFYQGQLTPLGR